MRQGSPLLSPLTTLGVGGPAEMLVVAPDLRALRHALELARTRGLPLLPLGGGSNIVVADAGVKACVVRSTHCSLTVSQDAPSQDADDVRVTVGAGLNWDTFVSEMVSRDLQGLECLSGIPGQVGATPVQNVGAYGQEVAETIESVLVLELDRGELLTLTREQCAFGYRESFFKHQGKGRYFIVEVTFRLKRGRRPHLRYGELRSRLQGTHPSLAQVRAAVLDLRREKSMLGGAHDENGRSCGSFFVNVETDEAGFETLARAAQESPPRFPTEGGTIKVPSAWLIERAGFSKGQRQGPVGLSTKHSLCIVAHAGAQAAHVVAFAWELRRRVEERFGVTLIPEPQFWGFPKFDRGLPVLPEGDMK